MKISTSKGDTATNRPQGIVVADVLVADVVTPDDEDVGILVRGLGRGDGTKERHASLSRDKPI